jgi:hypothetical protein
MRMLLIHGISQEGKSSKIIHDDWMGILRDNFARHRLADASAKLSRIDAAFYGDRLKELSGGWVSGNAIAQGAEEATDDFDEFAIQALENLATRLKITRQAIEHEAADTTVAQGAGVHKKWVKAIARLIEKVSPLRGTLAIRVLGQAHAYLRNHYVHDEINNLVRPLFEDDEAAIVVSHSLGTVISYSILRQFERNGRPRRVPLFFTLGSPLGIDSVRKIFTKPRGRPANVARWFNGADPEDFVALREKLKGDFGPYVEDYPDFKNGYDNPHSIAGYLADKRVAHAIAQAVA